MLSSGKSIFTKFQGKLQIDPELFVQKFLAVRAYVFDWDGVFNNGAKDEGGSSTFSEVDAMGTNLLRFNYFLRQGQVPISAIITGEKNQAAFSLAKREHFSAVYFGIKNKKAALGHLCEKWNLTAPQIAFIFDDVLDFATAQACGLRFMMARDCNPLLEEFANQRGLVDYQPASRGSSHAVREICELLLGLSGRYDQTIEERMQHGQTYVQYLEARNSVKTLFFTSGSGMEINEQLS